MDIRFYGNDYYRGNFTTIPLVQMKYARSGGTRCINEPLYDPDNKVALDEMFWVITDVVLPNIITERYLVSTYGRIYDRVYGKFLNPVGNGKVNADGTPNPYYKVKLSYYKSWNEIASKDVYIHRAVLLTFNYVCYAEDSDYSKLEVDHINGDHSDNRLVNLRWINHSKNVQSAYYNGQMGNSNLVDPNFSTNDPRQPIRLICGLLQDGYTNGEISEMTNIPAYQISRVRRGEIYKEYSREYNIPQKSIQKEQYETVVMICEMLASGEYTITRIAEMLKVPRHIVSDIKNRRNYTYISCNYTW